MTPKPSENGIIRDVKGRFAKGTERGPGRPPGTHVQSLRNALLQEAKPADMKAVARKLIELAREGDVAAAKLILDRLLGPPQPLDILERIEVLEDELR